MDITEKQELDKVMASNVIDPSKIGPKEGLSIDFDKFDKQNTTIEKVSIQLVPSTFAESGKQFVLKVESGVLASIGEGEDKFEVRASELFNLLQRDDKNTEPILDGFPVGDKSNLGQFVRDLKINIEEMDSLQKLMDTMKGKQASIKVYEKEKDGKKKKYMKFRY